MWLKPGGLENYVAAGSVGRSQQGAIIGNRLCRNAPPERHAFAASVLLRFYSQF
jgi:hypothetical protein